MTAIVPLTFLAAVKRPPSDEGGRKTRRTVVGAVVASCTDASKNNSADAALYFRLCTFGLYGLFPMFPKAKETLTKAFLYVVYLTLSWDVLSAEPLFPRDPPGTPSDSEQKEEAKATVKV